MEIAAEKLVNDIARDSDNLGGRADDLDRGGARDTGYDAEFAEYRTGLAAAEYDAPLFALDPSLGLAAHQHEHRIGAFAEPANLVAGAEADKRRLPGYLGKGVEIKSGKHLDGEEFRHDDDRVGAHTERDRGERVLDHRRGRLEARLELGGGPFSSGGLGGGERRNCERGNHRIAIADKPAEDFVGWF